MLVSTPLFHTAALFCWLAPAWSRGATVILGGKWSAERFTNQVETHRVTAAFLVPTQISDLLAAPAPASLGSLRLICHAGAPMRPDLTERLSALLPHVDITEHYGLSETGLLTVRRGGDPADQRASVGRAPAPVELAVRGPDGAFLPPGMIGEIATRGPHLMSDLIGGDGAFPVGRRLVRDRRSRLPGRSRLLTLVARSKDIIVSGRKTCIRARSRRCWAAIRRWPNAPCSACRRRPAGRDPVAQVVLRPGMTASEAELIELVLSVLPRHKRPRRILFANSLPRSAVGKVLKSALAAAYLQDNP